MPLNDCVPPETVDPTSLSVVIIASAVTQLQADGVTTRTLPAIQATWTPPVGATITGVQFNVQPPSGQAITSSPQAIGNAKWVLTDGVIPGVAYAVSFRTEASGSFGDWSVPATITLAQDFQVYNPLGPSRLRTVSGASDTLIFNDRGAYVRYTSASPVAVTVPPNASVAFELTTCVALRQVGAGAVTVVPGAGVTVHPPFGGTLTLAGAGALVQLVQVAANEWDLLGQVADA